MKIFPYAFTTLSFLSDFSSVAMGQTVEWMDGSVRGNGCSMDDTSIFSFGDEISYVFSRLGINLSAGVGAQALNKFCHMTADARVDRGHYVAELRQVLSYGGIKTQWGSQASIMTSAQFYGYHIKPFKITLRNGVSFDMPVVSETLIDKGTPVTQGVWWCQSNRNPRGSLKGRIDVKGELVGPDKGSLALNAQGFDIKYASTIIWASCS